MEAVIRATDSPSLEKQPIAASSRAGRTFLTSILYRLLRTSAIPGCVTNDTVSFVAVLCHIVTQGRAILGVKGSQPSLLEAESLSPDSAFFISLGTAFGQS